MGNTCNNGNTEPMPQDPLSFQHLNSGSTTEMVSISDHQELQHNFQNQKKRNMVPDYTFARRVIRRPKISAVAEMTLARQLGVRELESDNADKQRERGVKLPVHYIYQYQGYYDGEWSNGLPHGRGKIYFNNNAYYEGYFNHGEIACQDGIYIDIDGSFKRGAVKRGKMEGFGIFISKDGKFKYEGNWKDGKPNGKGVESYPDGSSYEGQFVNGNKYDDNGTYRWPNGKVYTGQFRNGYMQGQGKLYLPQGKGQYIGEFSRNLIIGHGKMKTQTGVYIGTFEDGLMHGKGEFHWYEGKVYRGEFWRGQLHGQGQIWFPGGQVVEGVWHYGENLRMTDILAREL